MNLSTPQIEQPRIVPHERERPGLWVCRLNDAGRRLLDVVAAVVGLACLWPLFLFIAIRIRRDSPGPIFYWGPRVGKDGKVFHIVKFRTMYERPESYDGPKITGGGDSRVTPVGRWLRESKFNELPQLWNVLRGEMSLVGPRPEDPDFVLQWPEGVREELLSVRPGITSPASVLYRDEEALLQADNVVADYLREVMPTKLRLDLIYVRHRTLLTDMDVIFWTIVTLLPRLKRKRVPGHALFWGPLSRFASRHFSWFLVDLFVSLIAVTAAAVIWRSGQPLNLGLKRAVVVALTIAGVFGVVNVLMGLDRVYWSKAPPAAIFDLGLSCGLSAAGVVLVNHFWPGGPFVPGGMLLVAGLLVFLGCAVLRYRTRILTGLATRWINLRGRPHVLGERVLIVGAGEVGNFAAWLLRQGDFARDLAQLFTVVGMVDDAPRKQGVRVNGLPVLGSASDIPELVAGYDIGLILFAIAEIDAEERQRILELCRGTPARVVLVPNVLESVRQHFVPADGRAPGEGDPNLDQKQLGQWLSELDRLLQVGAWEQAQESVQRMRTQITN